jgi:3-keto steroid reductase
MVQRVHFLGVEADLCDLRSIYRLADQMVNGTVGGPEATTMDGLRLPHGSPGTHSYSENIEQDRWALSQVPGSIGAQRSWGWGLSGIKLPRLDVVVLNAGIGGWLGVDWFRAIKDILTDAIEATTRPKFKIPDVGAVVRSQKNNIGDEAAQPLLDAQEKLDEPPLGQVFCANIFGHYLLVHELMPLLSIPANPSAKSGGKIIWISSTEAVPECFSIDDIQGLKSQTPYESTKRLADLLALTSDLPSVARISAPFYDPFNTTTSKKAGDKLQKDGLVKPKMYLAHPGVFTSEIFELNFILMFFWKMLAVMVRWLGSPWHPASHYKAAVAPAWVALAEPEVLEDLEGEKVKWGSATSRGGEERVMKTEVEGWGWDGSVGGEISGDKRIGRRAGALNVTKEARDEFEVLGGKAWKEMEALRIEWEHILGV